MSGGMGFISIAKRLVSLEPVPHTLMITRLRGSASADKRFSVNRSPRAR